MSNDIRQAKRTLPLPTLMHQLGLGEHAKRSARCPFHGDQHNSFSVWKNGAGLWFWKCHTGCGEGDEINLHKDLNDWTKAGVSSSVTVAVKRPNTERTLLMLQTLLTIEGR